MRVWKEPKGRFMWVRKWDGALEKGQSVKWVKSMA